MVNGDSDNQEPTTIQLCMYIKYCTQENLSSKNFSE